MTSLLSHVLTCDISSVTCAHLWHLFCHMCSPVKSLLSHVHTFIQYNWSSIWCLHEVACKGGRRERIFGGNLWLLSQLWGRRTKALEVKKDHKTTHTLSGQTQSIRWKFNKSPIYLEIQKCTEINTETLRHTQHRLRTSSVDLIAISKIWKHHGPLTIASENAVEQAKR